MPTADIIRAHRHSIRHREEVLASQSCGCFYCGAAFPPTEINDWIDEWECDWADGALPELWYRLGHRVCVGLSGDGRVLGCHEGALVLTPAPAAPKESPCPRSASPSPTSASRPTPRSPSPSPPKPSGRRPRAGRTSSASRSASSPATGPRTGACRHPMPRSSTGPGPPSPTAAGRANVAVVLGTERVVNGGLPVASALVVNADGTVAGFQDKVQIDPSEEPTYAPARRPPRLPGRPADLRHRRSATRAGGTRRRSGGRPAAGPTSSSTPTSTRRSPASTGRPRSRTRRTRSTRRPSCAGPPRTPVTSPASTTRAPGSPTTSAVVRPDGTLLVSPALRGRGATRGRHRPGRGDRAAGVAVQGRRVTDSRFTPVYGGCRGAV